MPILTDSRFGQQLRSAMRITHSSSHTCGTKRPDALYRNLAFRKKLDGVHMQGLRDAFEQVERGCEPRVFDLAHVTPADIRPMGKFFLAEAAAASQVLNVQRYTVSQFHDREPATRRKIVPRDICYIRECGRVISKRREAASLEYLPGRGALTYLHRWYSIPHRRFTEPSGNDADDKARFQRREITETAPLTLSACPKSHIGPSAIEIVASDGDGDGMGPGLGVEFGASLQAPLLYCRFRKTKFGCDFVLAEAVFEASEYIQFSIGQRGAPDYHLDPAIEF